MKTEEGKKESTGLAVFNPMKVEVAKWKEINDSLKFEYETPKGEKEARSHIYKLRGTKSSIAVIHKAAKAEALAHCKAVDAEKNWLVSEVEKMITVHSTPLRAIEERECKIAAEKAEAERLEKERVEQERLDAIQKREDDAAAKEAELKAAEEAIRQEEQVRQTEIKAEEDARQTQIKHEEDRLAREREKFEADKRAEQEAREREKNARLEAEKKAEQEKQVAIKKAEREKQEAIETERKRIADMDAAEKAEEKRLAEIKAKRIAKKKHRDKIDAEILSYLYGVISDGKVAETVLYEIRSGGIPHVELVY